MSDVQAGCNNVSGSQEASNTFGKHRKSLQVGLAAHFLAARFGLAFGGPSKTVTGPYVILLVSTKIPRIRLPHF